MSSTVNTDTSGGLLVILLHVSFRIYVFSITQEQQLEALSSSGCQSSVVMKVEGHGATLSYQNLTLYK